MDILDHISFRKYPKKVLIALVLGLLIVSFGVGVFKGKSEGTNFFQKGMNVIVTPLVNKIMKPFNAYMEQFNNKEHEQRDN